MPGPPVRTPVEEGSRRDQEEFANTLEIVRQVHRRGELVLFTSALLHLSRGEMSSVGGTMVPWWAESITSG